ncbi:cobalamin-dependent protein [Candidatus Sumerlaeota bacterium]|nr:cobalamin-dependent protein [Candidatus Sumerlaeota bacterium]
MTAGTGQIVLVNPRATYVNEIAQKCYPPLNLLYLAANLRKNGFDVDVIDANALRMSDEELAERLSAEKPFVFGLSFYSEILQQLRDLTRLAKRCVPGVQVVAGGPHANAVPETTLAQFESIDALILGEAEESFVSYCRTLRDGGDLRQVPGIVLREGEGLYYGPEPTRPDLSKLPLPARDLVRKAYDLKRYHSLLVRQRPVDTIMTSRGCPGVCGFCYSMNRHYRGRSAEDVVHELTSIRERGIRNVEIVDDTFTANRRRAMEVFDLIVREKLDISFRIKSRVNMINEEFVRKAKAAGVYLVSYGMESGSQRILDAMRKGTKVEQNAQACLLTKKHGIAAHSGWVFGYPGETLDTIEETVNFILKIKPTTVNTAFLRPYPNTEAYHIARDQGMLRGDWTPENADFPWVQLPWIKSREEVQALLKKIMRKVYFRPYYVWSIGSDIVRNANWTMLAYAMQEGRRVLFRAR